MIVGSQEDLERHILKYLADQKRTGEEQQCYVEWDKIADQLETSEKSVTEAWAIDFRNRHNLLSSAFADGIIFSLVS